MSSRGNAKRGGGKQWRIQVMNETRDACTPKRSGGGGPLSYQLPGGTRVIYCSSLNEMIEQQIATNKFYNCKSGTVSPPPTPNPQYDTIFDVIDKDCLQVAHNLQSSGLNPVLLNMTSSRSAGGGYKHGAAAQEENLFRRTNLLRVLANEDRWYAPSYHQIKTGKAAAPPETFYPLPPVSTIYSPSVYVLRGAESDGYPWLEDYFTIPIISSAAIRCPVLDYTTGEARLADDDDAMLWLEKIRLVLGTAIVNNHDAIVLSAWGCGAYGNPPGHVAELFHQVLCDETSPYKGHFKNVSFAIFDDQNAYQQHNPQGNLLPFQKAFAHKSADSVADTSSPPAQPSTSSSSSVTSKAETKSIPGGEKAKKKKK